ncbi:hypothetical protein PYW08_001930 [Mythimna loreyi]|uniref:Uncharacterized protein n=1 Tax=Mythimna loreyi TaxID=667449 RepID=A0ACC2R313_9NEOP|nr:hypothetical protein PYW08_001930 [Mythimna loreyi]
MDNYENDNITVRKTSRAKSVDNILNNNLSTSSTLLDTTMMSLPNASPNDSDSSSLKDEIRRLNMELESAHLEIDNLNSENFRLKMDIGQYQKIIETYKKVKLQETKRFSPISARKRNFLKTSSFSTPTKSFSPSILPSNHEPIKKATTLDVGDSSFNTAGSICSTDEIVPTKSLLINDVENSNMMTNKIDYDIDHNERNNHTSLTSGKNLEMTNIPTPNKEPEKLKQQTVTKETQRVMIYADQTGYGVRNTLQELLGEKFAVTSYLKPNATTEEVLKTCVNTCKNFNKSDFVIILTGSNDINPMNIQTYLHHTLCQLKSTNVLVGQIYKNRTLNENNVNNLLKFVCYNCKNSSFIQLHNDSRYPTKYMTMLNACRLIHRQILHMNYKNNFIKYTENLSICRKQIKTKDVAIQTCSVNDVSVQTDNIYIETPLENFFRDSK